MQTKMHSFSQRLRTYGNNTDPRYKKYSRSHYDVTSSQASIGGSPANNLKLKSSELDEVLVYKKFTTRQGTVEVVSELMRRLSDTFTLTKEYDCKSCSGCHKDKSNAFHWSYLRGRKRVITIDIATACLVVLFVDLKS